MRRRFFSFILFLALTIAGLGLANFVFAQSINVGMDEINSTIGLAATDPRIVVARIINIALLFLGVIAVALIIYAGFLWMTSGGNEDKVDQAKKVLKNAVIGLIIILSSWGIATFILNRLIGATGGVGAGTGNTNNPGALTGAGAIGACSVERVYPEDGQKDIARNTSIMVSFKESILLDSVCQNEAGEKCACGTGCELINPEHIRIFRDDIGDSCNSSSCPDDSTNVSKANIQASSDRKSFVITPQEFLGETEGAVAYSIKITGDLLKDNNESIFKTCSSDYLQWGFEVSNVVDLTPPQVAKGGIFPLPDNEKDIFGQSQVAVAAVGKIQVSACPNIYQAAAVTAVTATAGENGASAVIDSDYHSSFKSFSVVSVSNNNQAQLFTGTTLLGVADWQGNKVAFDGFFELEAAAHVAGNAWQVTVSSEVLADNLSVGTETYTFAATSTGNNILVKNSCDINEVATNIYTKLSGHPDINVDKTAALVTLTAKVAGLPGNNLRLVTNNPASLVLTPFDGGSDLVRTNETKDKNDRPMNSVIQINFNEAINPLHLSGTSDEVGAYIRVVNAEGNIKNEGECVKDGDCSSYSCVDGTCRGDYLAGKFMVSNAYKTVEFISNQECGVNGCGEKIYCLPANSHLGVELVSANMRTCELDTDCLRYQPFTSCAADVTGKKICRDPNGHNYPVANPEQLDGIVDAALNSLDGNRDVFADGPISFYNENDNSNLELKDKYKWSFYINDTIMSTAPRLNSISPENDSGEIEVNVPVEIKFNTLMMNSSLRTGNVMVNNGQRDIEHHLLNIFSSSPVPLGYWVTAENKDVAPLDGEPDLTFVNLGHTALASSVSYKIQAGSGLKDIYQNCYKPSAGVGCEADEENPSCCYGVPAQLLGEDGNCQ